MTDVYDFANYKGLDSLQPNNRFGRNVSLAKSVASDATVDSRWYSFKICLMVVLLHSTTPVWVCLWKGSSRRSMLCADKKSFIGRDWNSALDEIESGSPCRGIHVFLTPLVIEEADREEQIIILQ